MRRKVQYSDAKVGDAATVRMEESRTTIMEIGYKEEREPHLPKEERIKMTINLWGKFTLQKFYINYLSFF